nr:hypothetical protein [Tanacetum cinerariifolium]
GGLNDEGNSLFTMSVNTKALVIDTDPLTVVHPLKFAENIEFPSAKDLKDSVDCHFVVAHVVLDNMLNNRSRKLMTTLSKAKASCDAILEKEVEKDKAYVELERKCNKALQDLDKNPLMLDMRSKIKTLQGQVDKIYGEYSRLVLEQKKWVTYEQALSILYSKFKGLESKRERLKNSETQLLQDINGSRQDRVVVVSKVVPHVATKL